MNARLSHCMNKVAPAAAAMLLSALAAGAQTLPYDRVVRDNVWLVGTNPAGLRDTRTADISDVALYGGAETGGFRRSWESPTPWRAGAAARTVKHLDRFSMKGGFSFEQMSGPDMCGSMSVRPGYYPLDVLEFTPGRKTRQTYAFEGSISVDLKGGWRLGAGMDFTSANYAKRKDLRHTDYLLDMTVTPGLSYTVPSGGISFGLNYIYRKNSESITAEQVGTGESSYYAFLDKGLMYGKYEVWTGSGVHLDEAGVQGFPQKEQFHGLGLQVSAAGYYFDIEYLRGNGSAGEKQSVWYRFPSHNVNIRFAENFSWGSRRVFFREYFSWRLQTNDETVLDKVVSGGVTTTEEYGSNRIFSREAWTERLELTVARTGFEYLVAVDMGSRFAVASQMYPYITESDLFTARFSVSPTWYRDKYDFGFTAGFGYGTSAETDRMAAEDSGVLTQPFRLQDYYDRELQYDTAPKADVSAFVRRHLPLGLSLQAEGSFLRAFGSSLPDDPYRLTGLLTLYWTF